MEYKVGTYPESLEASKPGSKNSVLLSFDINPWGSSRVVFTASVGDVDFSSVTIQDTLNIGAYFTSASSSVCFA